MDLRKYLGRGFGSSVVLGVLKWRLSSLFLSLVLLSVLIWGQVGLAENDCGSPPWDCESIDSFGDVGRYTSLALDRADYPHISYSDRSNLTLKYAWWDGSRWGIRTVDPDAGGCYTSLALDHSGYAHIGYISLSSFTVKYARWDGYDWDIDSDIEPEWFFGTGVSLALDRFDYPHMSYAEYGIGDLRYARWDGSRWRICTVESADGEVRVNFETSLALDRSGYPHIIYDDRLTGCLKYTWWDGSRWRIRTVDPDAYIAGSGISLALDHSEYPHISYYDVSDRALKYAWWDGSRWHIRTVESDVCADPRTCGFPYTSLDLDHSDYPHISYSDRSDRALKYARWDGSRWDICTVGTSGRSCLDTSLVLDSCSYPHISYYDSSNDDLKYAWEDSSAVAITKTGPAGAAVGDTITYTFEVTNDTVAGEGSPIADVNVTDSLGGPATYVSGDTDNDGLLEAGETWTYRVTYTVQSMDPYSLRNTATVMGEDSDGHAVCDSDGHSVNVWIWTRIIKVECPPRRVVWPIGPLPKPELNIPPGPCGDGTLCLWYNFIIDFAEAGLGPEAVTIALVNSRGELVANGRMVEGSKVVSFKPAKSWLEGDEEKLFLVLQLSPQVELDTKYNFLAHLEITGTRQLER